MKLLAGLAMAGLVSLSDVAHAGGPLGEIEYRYPCVAPQSKSRIEMSFDRGGAAAVEYDVRFGRPVLLVNEQLSFEQPFEVVAFEYFSACEMAKLAKADTFKRAQVNAEAAADLFQDADCAALDRMEREGMLRGYEGFETILSFYQNRKAAEKSLNTPFWQRASRMSEHCPP